ncbi:MAG TPA: hypothetical protein PK252_03390 [Bacteroidales bacterium]|nr:hypothetical protein [Bacteroidales bacterium]
MMKIFLVIVLIDTLAKTSVFSQNIVPFEAEAKYGIKNKYTGKILIPAKYNRIQNYNDSVIIVQSRDFRYGAIDTLDNILIPFANEQLFIENYNPLHLGQIIESSNFNNEPEYSSWYYIDKNRNCIPYDYCPCPSWKKLSPNLSISSSYAQNGFKAQFNGHLDSAFYWINMAIANEPQKASLYYYKAQFYLKDNKGAYLKHLDTLDILKKQIVDTSLSIALKYENRPVFVAQIMSLQSLFYKRCFIQKNKLEEVQTAAKSYDFMRYYEGLFFIGGLTYNHGLEVETGFGRGSFTLNDKHQFNPYTVNSTIFYGGSWLRNFSSNIDGYKIYLISILKPLRFGICPILYTNYKKNLFVIRPEFGYGFNFLTISAGYNIRVADNGFPDLKTFNINLRYYLPLFPNKSFSAQKPSKI